MKKIWILSLLALSFSASAQTEYSCFGTEPFWGLKMNSKEIAFDIAGENSPKIEKIVSKTSAQGMVETFAFAVKTQNSTATIITGECNDGMSDNIYPLHIFYTTGKSAFYGCCRLNN